MKTLATRTLVSLTAVWLAACSSSTPEEPVAGAVVQPAVFSYLRTPRESLQATGLDGNGYLIRADTAAFTPLTPGALFELILPDSGRVVVRVLEREEHSGGASSLRGTVVGSTESQVHLAMAGDAISGIVAMSGREWQIRSTARGSSIQNEEAAGHESAHSHGRSAYEWARRQHAVLAPDAPPGPSARPGEAPPGPLAAQSTSTAAATAVAREAPKAASASAIATLDLFVVGDLSYQGLMGSEANELADVAAMISYANGVFASSNAWVRLRLAGYRRLNVDHSSTDLLTVLRQVRDGSGGYAALWPTQRELGSDITVSLSRYNDAKGSFCGYGDIGTFSSKGVLSTSMSAAVTVARGTRSSDRTFCTDSTLAHEVGHVLGSNHDRANTSAGSGGAYTFSYGYGVDGVFGDIMSYLRPRVAYFSSPSLLTCAGQACGTATDDAVRTFNNTAPLVATVADADSRLSGWYWDPSASGTGWAVEVANGKAFVAAFVYRDDGQPTWVSGLGAACSGRPTVWCIGLDEYADGQTLTGGPRTARVARRVVDAELSFSAGYPPTMNVQMGAVTRSLQRFVFSANGLSVKPTVPGAAIPGWYWNASAPGTGMFMERQNNTTFAAYFYYRSDGTPAWSMVTGDNYTTTFNASGSFSYSYNRLEFARYQSGQPLLGAYRQPAVANNSEASSYLGADTGVMTLWNAAGTRQNEVWSKFAF